MKPEELRIGNWVQDVGHVDRPYQIQGFGQNNTCLDEIGVGWIPSKLEPIPLTEEWLERFGFIPYDEFSHPCFERNGYLVSYVYGKWDVQIGSIRANRLGLDYVHQLQNLYFALTGEELELKELAE